MKNKLQEGKILIVDDNPTTIDLLRSSLNEEGYNLFVAINGEKAITRAEQTEPDLILLDVLMPGIDGFETCRRLKRKVKTREIPVIFMTGLTDVEDKVLGFDAGGVDFITKPIEIAEVLARIKTHIKLRLMSQQLEDQNKQLKKEVAERKRAEKKVLRLNSELEQRVEKRTADLKNANIHLENEIKEREKAEEELRSSEEKYRLIAENTADVINIFDFKLKPLFISPSVINLRGVPVEEAMKQKLNEILTPKSFKKIKEAFTHQIALERDKTADPNRSIRLELEAYHKNGNTIWVELAASIIRDKDKKATGILTITREITKRKQAELRLIESEYKFRSLAESSPDNILRHDTDGRLIYFNHNLKLTFGLNFDHILGKKPEEYQDFKWPENYLVKLKKVIETGEPDETEALVQNHQGEIRTHHIRFVVERNNEGEIIGALAIGQDITERKKAEETLRKLSHTVEQSPASIIITDINGKIEYTNPKFTEVTLYSSEEAIGQNLRILSSGESSEEIYNNLWDTILSGKVWRGEFQNRKKNGELYWESTTISPIKDELGEITHFLAIKEDIGEIKQLQEQLMQAQKMEAIGQLAGGVSHDFNNMLSVIIGYSEIVLMKVKETQEIYSDLLEIRKAASRSADLTRQLLTFARKQTVMPVILNLNETVDGMLKMLKRLISEQIKLNWSPSPDLWDIKIDPSQLDQVLANLCVNARDAIEDVGEISISTHKMNIDEMYCTSRPGMVPGEYVVLSVSDTGSGMDKDTLNRIFEPFFTTKSTGKGTGLGLSTIYGIVKQNLGYIDVASELEQGTVFNIFLPRYVEKTTKVQKDEKTTKIVHGNETILLVEDEEIILEMTKQMLTDLGYQVLSSSSPDEAVLLAEKYEDQIDLLLTDIILPEMNGVTLAEKLKNLYPEIRCLFMSGYSGDYLPQDEDLQFIQKPFSISVIADKIRETIDK